MQTTTQTYAELIKSRRAIEAEAKNLEAKALAAHRELDQDSRDAYLERASELWLKIDNVGRSAWCKRFIGMTARPDTTAAYIAAMGPR